MPVFTDYPTTKQTSLNDILGPLSSMQQYQQAKQLNPIQLQKAQLELEQAQKLNPLAVQEAELKLQQTQAATPTAVLKSGIEGQVLDQTNQERKALMEFQKNPDNWSTNGRVDLDKINKSIPLIAPLTGAEHIDKLTKLGTAQTTAIEGKQNLTQKEREIVSNRMGLLGRLGIEDPEIVRAELKRLKHENPDNPDLHRVIDAYDVPYSMTKPGKHVTQDLVRSSQSMLSPTEQQEALTPKAGTVDTGAQIMGTTTTPSIGGNAPNIQMGSALANKTLAPSIFANPITGQPQQVGGVGGSLGGMSPNPMGIQGQPGSSTMPQSSGQKLQGGPLPPGAQLGAPQGGQLNQLPNESPANFNARMQAAQSTYSKAIDQYSNPQSQFGHIPTTQQLNKNVLDLLKDPGVGTGAIADFLAGKTNKGSLNTKEQELAKYLEQRIQNIGPRTDAAAINLKNAYGSYNLGKDTLKNLIRQDNVWVTTQDLQAKGIIKNGGNQVNPDYNKIQNFNQQFSMYASNPALMQYISMVGEDKKANLDPDDHGAFTQFIKNHSPAERQMLEAKRQQLLKLVGGQ